MSSRASLPLPPAARVPLLLLSPVAPSWFHPGASLSLPDSSPPSNIIHLALVQNSGYLVLIPVICLISRFLPSQREISPSLSFIYFSFSHVKALYYYLSPVSLLRRTLTFLNLSFLKQPCQQLSFSIFHFSFSYILNTMSRISLLDSLSLFLSIALLPFSPSPSLLPTRFPSFHVSRFPSLLRCPSSPMFHPLQYDSHQLFLDAALPTKVRGVLFPTPAGVQPEVLACAARSSIYLAHLRSCQAGCIPAAVSHVIPCARTDTFTLHIVTGIK